MIYYSPQYKFKVKLRKGKANNSFHADRFAVWLIFID